MPPVLQQFPDLAPLRQQRDDAALRIQGVLNGLGGLGADSATSPLAPVVGALGQLGSTLDVDVSGLATRLPASIATIRNTIPAGALEHVAALENTYAAAQGFLSDNPLARQVAEGSSLQEVALGVIAELLGLFDTRLAELTGGIFDAERVQQVVDALRRIGELATDFDAHRDELLPFLGDHVLGVAPDLLREPLEHLEAALAVLAPLGRAEIDAALAPARQLLAEAFGALLGEIESFDAASADAYTRLLTQLDRVDAAIDALDGVLTPLYQQAAALAGNPALDSLFSTLQSLLAGIEIEAPFSVDDVVDSIAGVLEELLAGVFMLFDEDDLRARVERLSQVIRDTFVHSALGQVRDMLRGFLGDIRDAIENVPTEEIERLVEEMLQRVRSELEALGIGEISQAIEDAFGEAEELIGEVFNDDLTQQVRDAVEQVLAGVDNLQIGDYITLLGGAVEQLDGVIEQIEDTLGERMDELTAFIAQLDELSFQPLSDEVIREIDALKARLQAINPNALSDAEKLAIRGALAVLEAIDLDGQVVQGLKAGYAQAEAQVLALLRDLTAILERLRAQFGAFDPGELLGPLGSLLDQVDALVSRLNGGALLSPLQAQVDRLTGELEALAPGRLLDPLQQPYDTMMQTVRRLDPAQWVAPLRSLYEQIDRLIDVVDVTPLLEELDQRQRALFGEIRAAILAALDAIELPEPLDGLLAVVRPILEGLTEAVFGDPDTELRELGARVAEVRLDALFEPLDAVYDRLVEMLERVPAGALTDTANTLRQAIGVGLDRLDPRAITGELRQAQARLEALDPTSVLSLPLGLPGARNAFQLQAAGAPAERQADVAAVSARFDAVFARVDPAAAGSLFPRLRTAHAGAVDALRLRINRLDPEGAEQAFARLRDDLERLLPDFLRQTQPLTHAQVLAGFYALRPSSKAEKIERVLNGFLQRVTPLQEAVMPAIEGFFASIREILMLLNPLDLRGAVAEIYQAVRDKVRILDPDRLADSIRENFFAPLLEPLEALDPAAIKQRLDELFARLLEAVSTTVRQVLSDLAAAIDARIRPVRDAIRALLQQIRDAVAALFQRVANVLGRVEQLVFVEILERLERVIRNLGVSFERELDRVRNAFNDMLRAIPLGGGGGSAGVGLAA